jgi:ABC-type branched-subunit amino acid transport system substrate-binding protein
MTRCMLAWLGFTLLGIALVQPVAAQKKAPEALLGAEISGGVVKLGVLTDETGVLSSPSGEGSIEATRMAVEDFGSKAAGKPIEIIHADHQNKTDIGAAIARRWINVDGVDAIVDVPNSAIALAVQEIAKGKNRVLLVSTAAISPVKRARRSACIGPGTPTPLPAPPRRSCRRAAIAGSS